MDSFVEAIIVELTYESYRQNFDPESRHTSSEKNFQHKYIS